MQEAQSLPTRFPCWVRAKFSFGGESKHDLGFIEGDLIECLNAGDGSWWMGRLWRDKRMKGLFPSNFVEVLPASFRPAVRSSSPMSHRSPSTSPFNPQSQNAKAKPSRKPFQSYSAPNPVVAKNAEIKNQEGTLLSRGHSPVPPVHENITRVPSPQIYGYGSRVPSPAPPLHRGYGSRATSPSRNHSMHRLHGLRESRAPSPSLIFHHYGSRARSPSPTHHAHYSRATSPAPEAYQGYHHAPSPANFRHNSYHSCASSPSRFGRRSSPPPPAPPPHRLMYTAQKSTKSHEYHASGYHTPRAVSPCPPSPGGTGLTPSPLRTAMDDVISSLADMGVSRNQAPIDHPLDPWSPEAFDQTYSRMRTARAHTTLEHEDQFAYLPCDQSHPVGRNAHYVDQPPPQLSNYVQRMESRLNRMHHRSHAQPYEEERKEPAVTSEVNPYERPKSSMAGSTQAESHKLRHRKSAYEMGKSVLGRTFTTKTNSTSSSSGCRSTTTNGTIQTNSTDRSLMSGPSASGFSYTSAGSLERKKEATRGRAQSALGMRKDQFIGSNGSQAEFSGIRAESPVTGISYHSSHASVPPRAHSQLGWHASSAELGSVLGGLTAPRPKKSGFFKKMIETAKTGAASARTSIAVGESLRQGMPSKMLNEATSIMGDYRSNPGSNVAAEMGLGGGNAGIDWVQVRRDVNRSNSLSRNERVERRERCQMMDYPTINPVEELYEQCDGDEGVDGQPVPDPTNFQAVNLGLVDKNTRFINSLPPMTNAISLATGFVCRPYRSDVQRLRAIFSWTSEKITWEEDYDGDIDSRRVIQTKRGCAQEVAVLVTEMCTAVGIHAEVIRGYLKTPGEVPELNITLRANHWWNAVAIDGEWRIMDCSLAAPSHPRRGLYSSCSSQVAESWWFLARPMEICWTHVPENHLQQHLCPPIAHEVLLCLPCACPPFFKNALEMVDYDTSLVRIEDLELVHVKFIVPADVECVAEVEVRAFEKDTDGDFFESGEIVKKRALTQAEWIGGQKRYTVKALLPGDEGIGMLKIYAGKRGLMHSIKDIPHPLAFALPVVHTGDNPPYEFLTRHPTPHAQRHDLYVAQPQCQRLALNNTFVFAVRQHPSSLGAASCNAGGISPIPFIRPGSAMSLSSSSASGSNSVTSAYTSKKPAKLAIQAPGGKVLRLMRKEEKNMSTSQALERGDGGTWETIIKVGERGVWRGLVLADRSARWCVFAEWTCV